MICDTPTTYKNSAGNQRWRANWRDIDGKQRSRNFDDEESAASHERSMIAEREAAREPRKCAWPPCGELVVQPLVDGKLKGKRLNYHSPECALLAKNDTGSRTKRRQREATPRLPREPQVCKLAECNELVPDNPIGRPREFCKPEHGRVYHNRLQAQAKGPDLRHYILVADETTGLGTCSVCGPDSPIWSFWDTYKDGRPRRRHRCQPVASVGRLESQRAHTRSRLGWANKIRNRYGLSLDQYDALVLRAEGRCENEGCRALLQPGHIDHDPHTLVVRGLLCGTCNTGLGKLGDTIEGVEATLAYLRRAEYDGPGTANDQRQED